MGNPDKAHVSTPYVERQKLSMQIAMRHLTRLTNAFSKKLRSHERAIALCFKRYKFIRQHKTLRMSPATVAGVSKTLWRMEDIVALVDARATVPKRPKVYEVKGATA